MNAPAPAQPDRPSEDDALDRRHAAIDDGPAGVHLERSALRGSAWKRLASLHAREVLEPKATAAQVVKAGQAMRDALAESAKAYGTAEGMPGQPQRAGDVGVHNLVPHGVRHFRCGIEHGVCG